MALHTHPPPFGNSVEAVSPTQTLKIGSWDHPEQILTVMVTFVQATFVHIRNISLLTDLDQSFWTRFLGALIFLNLGFVTQILFLDTTFF